MPSLSLLIALFFFKKEKLFRKAEMKQRPTLNPNFNYRSQPLKIFLINFLVFLKLASSFFMQFLAHNRNIWPAAAERSLVTLRSTLLAIRQAQLEDCGKWECLSHARPRRHWWTLPGLSSESFLSNRPIGVANVRATYSGWCQVLGDRLLSNVTDHHSATQKSREQEKITFYS